MPREELSEDERELLDWMERLRKAWQRGALTNRQYLTGITSLMLAEYADEMFPE